MRKQTVRQSVVANNQAKSVACLKFISDSELLRNVDVLTGSQVPADRHWSYKI